MPNTLIKVLHYPSHNIATQIKLILYDSDLKATDLGHLITCPSKQKQKYRGIFETQKSGNKTSSGEIDLNIRTSASPTVGQDQLSGGVSVLC